MTTQIVSVSGTQSKLQVNNQDSFTFDNAGNLNAASVNGAATVGNILINGNMQIAQKGSLTVASSGSFYAGCDRWVNSISGTTVSATVLQTVNSGVASGYTQQIGNVITTGATAVGIYQRVESSNAYPLNGRQATFSGKVYQNTGSTQTLTVNFEKANTADAFSARTSLGSTTVSIPSGTWTPFSYTITFGATDCSNGIQVGANYASLGAQATTAFFFGSMDLRAGTQVPAYPEMRPVSRELADCQRYYWRQTATTTSAVYNGNFFSPNQVYGVIHHPVTMRIAPAFAMSAATIFNYNAGGTNTFSNSFLSAVMSPSATELAMTTVASLTMGHGTWARFVAAGNWFDLTAEL